jgi:hypothetical protein
VSLPDPNPRASDRRGPQVRTAEDARRADDLVRAALSQLGNDFKFPRTRPGLDDRPPSERAAERSEPAPAPAANAPRRGFSLGLGAIAIAYCTFPTVIALLAWGVWTGTSRVSAESPQHKLASPASHADSALSLRKERTDDRRLVVENAAAQQQPNFLPPAQPGLVSLTVHDLSPPSATEQPAVVTLPENDEIPVAALSSEGTAAEVAPTADAPLEPPSVAETSRPPVPIATAEPAEREAATVLPSETQPPETMAAAQPAVPAPREDTQAFRERGEALLARGDIVSARGFFEYAANHGDTVAAKQAGKTYDPNFLRHTGLRAIPGDSYQAAYWYRQAAGDGDPEAAAYLQRLLSQRRS